jgi:signal transduction histidine kinase
VTDNVRDSLDLPPEARKISPCPAPTAAAGSETALAPSKPDIKPLHIVGIGASAGGLAALEHFFDAMPADSGMAFVVIQHLTPDFKSQMGDLLSRHTAMPILRAADGIAPEPNHIYLNSSMTQLEVRDGKLRLTELAKNRHVDLPGTGRDGFEGVKISFTDTKNAEQRVGVLNQELSKHVAELQEANKKLEAETGKRIQALEELRLKEQMLLKQSRFAAMGEMFGNIAHQWRQPLNVLGLLVQEVGLSCDSGELDRQLLDANVARVMEIIGQMSQTIDDFQNLAAPDKNKSRFKAAQVIAKSVKLMEQGLGKDGITLEVDSSGDTYIEGYPNEYGQVFLNLLANARDALLERKTPQARITVRSWAENGRAVVTVTDNGGGIPVEIMDSIFDAYFTTKELGKGTGVGLFISKTIIEKSMGGRLTARNTAGGAEFRIEV